MNDIEEIRKLTLAKCSSMETVANLEVCEWQTFLAHAKLGAPTSLQQCDLYYVFFDIVCPGCRSGKRSMQNLTLGGDNST